MPSPALPGPTLAELEPTVCDYRSGQTGLLRLTWETATAPSWSIPACAG